MSQKISYFVLPTGGAASVAGDAVFKGGYLKIGGTTAAWLASMPNAIRNLSISVNGLKNGFYKAYAAEVARVITITPTAVNSTDYRIILSAEKGQDFSNNLPNEVQTVFTHTTPASGATATTIGDAFRTAINNHPFWSQRVTVTGTTTIIITAKAGYPIFSAGVGANLASVVSTAGSPVMGATGAQLLANGFAFNADSGVPVSGTNYDIFSFEISQPTEAVLSAGGDHRIVLAVVPGGNNATFISTLAGLITK
ncbi:MAG: hypothetical protein EBR30_07435 [Cytophagia bacterium]|nr:hypothetical protein [Cytophagia bacterium]